jgi:hypothetical protein
MLAGGPLVVKGCIGGRTTANGELRTAVTQNCTQPQNSVRRLARSAPVGAGQPGMLGELRAPLLFLSISGASPGI